MSEPRKHHYVPESYLARFTDTGTRKGNLWVFDRDKAEIRKSDPKNSGHQRDFYRLDDGVAEDPNYFEKSFGVIEGKASLAVDEILKTRKLPDPESMEYLISVIGLQAVRVPAYRKKMNSFQERVIKTVLDLACANETQWEYQKKQLQEAEPGRYADVPFKQAREYMDQPDFEVEIPQTKSIETMMESATRTVDLLYKRNWGIAFAEEGEFVTCDNPVILTSNQPRKRFLGFGMPGTEVIVPLSKNCVLFGMYEELPFTVGACDLEGVASVNTHICYRASRYIYGPSGDFIWLDDLDHVSDADKFLSSLAT